MKRPIYTGIISLFLVLCLLVGSIAPVLAATGTVSANQGTRHVLCTELSRQAEKYYTGQNSYSVLSKLSGRSAPTDSYKASQNNALFTALHELMAQTHTVNLVYEGFTSDSLAANWAKTDAEAGAKTYLYFYTDRLRSDIDSVTMNREHVWPKSKASFSQLGGGADLHHLRPSISTVNKAKSDYHFGDIADDAYGMTTSSVEGELVLQILKSADLVEVRDNIKGDIARILLYVYCRWLQPNLYSDVSTSNLPAMDEDDTANNGGRAIEDLDTLLRWCESDPVDQWEMGRNDQSENVQGNRNVFIDYPEFAWLMFGLTPPDTMKTPSGMASDASYKIVVSVNNAAYGSASLDGKVITAVPKDGYEVGGYQILTGSATVVREGNRFSVTPTSNCHIRIVFAPRSQVILDFSDGQFLSGYVGDTVTLPEATVVPKGYTFLGWVTEPVTDSTDALDFFPPNSSYSLTEDVYFYALYSYEVETQVSDGDYVKLTEAPEDWSGDYLLVYELYGYIFNGSLTAPNVNTNCRMATISNHTIPSVGNDNYRISIRKNDDGYSIRSASGIYIGNSSGYTGLAYGNTDSYRNTIAMNSNGSVTVTASSGAVLGFQLNQRKFQYFASVTSSVSPVCLYRKESTRLITHYTTLLPAACDHSYTAENCGDYHKLTCIHCGEVKEAPHEFTDGSCICGAVLVTGPTVDTAVVLRHSLNLASDISINYAVSATQLKNYDSFYLSCLLPVYENNVLTGSTEIKLEPVLNGSYYYFTLTGITAVTMADEIQATLYMTKDGKEFCSATDLYSVATYAYSQLNKASSTETLMTLCANLLRYGTAAQIYKGYRTDALADSAMTDIHRSYLCDLETVEFGTTNSTLSDLFFPSVTWAGKSLSLESKVVLRFIMNASSYSGSVEELTLRVSYTDYTGAKKTVVLTDPTVYDSAKSYYSFDFDGLLAAELRSDVSVAVYAGQRRISQTMEYSAATYGANKTGTLRTLCQALLAYSDAALSQFS